MLKWTTETNVIHDPKTCDIENCVACEWGVLEIQELTHVTYEENSPNG